MQVVLYNGCKTVVVVVDLVPYDTGVGQLAEPPLLPGVQLWMKKP